MRRSGERRHVQGLAVASVDDVLRTKEMPDRMGGRHRP